MSVRYSEPRRACCSEAQDIPSCLRLDLAALSCSLLEFEGIQCICQHAPQPLHTTSTVLYTYQFSTTPLSSAHVTETKKQALFTTASTRPPCGAAFLWQPWRPPAYVALHPVRVCVQSCLWGANVPSTSDVIITSHIFQYTNIWVIILVRLILGVRRPRPLGKDIK